MGGRIPRAYTDPIVLVDHDKTCCHAIAEASHNNVTNCNMPSQQALVFMANYAISKAMICMTTKMVGMDGLGGIFVTLRPLQLE